MAHGKRRVVTRVGAALALALLTACSTPYQPLGVTGGYTETRIAPDQYSVKFRGNGKTSADLVLNMYLFRCAELTLQNKFDVFASHKPDSQASVPNVDAVALMSDAEPPELLDYAAKGGGYVPVYVPGQTVTITSYGVSGFVRMGHYSEVPSNIKVWDARLVMSNLHAIVKDGRGAALPFDDIAKLGMVHGEAKATTGEATTTLDDLRKLIDQR